MTEAKRLDQKPGFAAIGYLPERVERVTEAPAEPVYTDMSDEERARLEAVYENAVSDAAAKPTLERPQWFTSEYEEYDWLFVALSKGLALEAEDVAFMQYYESTTEYKELTGFGMSN